MKGDVTNRRIAAVVLAAGESRRMGQPKLVLPWEGDTVIGKVVNTLKEAGLDIIIVVTGGHKDQVEKALSGRGVEVIFNPDFFREDMLLSCQIGLQSLAPQIGAALIVLGDQPQIEAGVVQLILQMFEDNPAVLLVPSYQMHRGHPWLVDRSLWPAILDLRPPETLKDFLVKNSKQITYVTIDSASIFQDLDTPEDYERYTHRSSV